MATAVSTISSYLGFNRTSPPPPKDANTPLRALPSNWYTSQEMYELERRAIFSRKWQLVTHQIRLGKAGDWLKFKIAGFEFVLTRDREGKINAFHNVCRHRAFPVVTGDQGSSKILACKYHGWSYGLNGKLAKAPGYQELDGFDKSQNGLFPVHVHLDCNGFIWVNLDANKEPEVAWKDDFDGVDTQDRYKQFNMEEYEFDHFWEMEGNYNWKILADNYNECYHCATTHPDIPALADLASYNVKTIAGQIIHDAATTDEQRRNGLTVASTYYFPNVSTNISPHFFMIQRFVPSSPTTSSMQYQVFRNKHSSEEDFQLVNNIYKRIMSEDKYLCDLAQKNLQAGIFVNGELHPRMEKGPLYFQKVCRDVVTGHHAREKREGREVWPARQTLPRVGAEASEKDVEFCEGLACGERKDSLVW
ncbi:hypothetical protein LTR35_000482 [Friedmanniomyces endolithicus]|nr:hypothetical protein LTS00_009324 [Friedmanniomyces endolithicus]KAK0293874.1 hypothetical protein LTR35_000482 [Friedmanniomyces endolithicus]KAK0991737.1 hypothetical protein LTR54_011658 [Friedmanniomyces endolithicus]